MTLKALQQRRSGLTCSWANFTEKAGAQRSAAEHGGYLGPDREAWRAYDAIELAAASRWRSEVLVDQGTSDDHLAVQLHPELLRESFAAAGIPLRLRMQPGYDHGYYFVASFIGEHLAHHANLLL